MLPRKAAVVWRLPWGQWQLGVQSFQWGLGLLACDGAQDTDFGDPWLGNLVVRAAFATRPLSMLALPPLFVPVIVTFVAP